jgi:hypothetical protein
MALKIIDNIYILILIFLYTYFSQINYNTMYKLR